MPIVRCAHCGREVEAVKPGFGCGWAFLWFLLGIIPGVIYIIYNRTKVADKCPACGKNVYH